MTTPAVPARPLRLALATLALSLACASPAMAYIDPNTSGTLMQIIAPVLIALGVLRQRIALLIRLAVTRMRRIFKRDERD